MNEQTLYTRFLFNMDLNILETRACRSKAWKTLPPDYPDLASLCIP